ncbi:hypothetical protein D4764_01G0016160 [Takifugu flavidus]|uniref:Uncharacterized protein n=1 Tax=Takifugu flavidus TaxID=433684 RepID=A0A5C6PSQ6_9TELE|nr:hypothetical protein D4764_01G0016160 [Takifugu flavidus]
MAGWVEREERGRERRGEERRGEERRGERRGEERRGEETMTQWGDRSLSAIMAANTGLTGLSRRHGVKAGAGSMLSVEEVALAAGQGIGHSSVKSTARVNRAVVLFLEKVEQANKLVETGITMGGAVRPARRRWCGAEGAPAVPDGAQIESQAEGKRSECVRETEVSGDRENVEMVVEVTGESGEAGKEMDGSREGNWGETGDMGQTGEQCAAVGGVGQVTGERGVPGIVAGELGEGGTSTGEVGVSTAVKKAEKCHEGRWRRGAGRLEGAAAATVTSDYDYMSDSSELSNTVADSERDDLYPSSMIKSFLTQTKGMRGSDLGIYFPDKLLFIQLASHWNKHRAASDLTDVEIFRLKKHMGKTRKQLK